jgi:hypothetical protein
VGFVLGGLAPVHYAMVPIVAGQLLPRAIDYYQFFASLIPKSPAGWHGIDLLKDARRGDIIAWEFPDFQPGQESGHVFFVADRQTVDDSGIFSVRAYDSADQPHFDDTRGDAPGEFPNGVGSGVIKFQVNDAGEPTAFQFAPSEPFQEFPIAIGRVEPL